MSFDLRSYIPNFRHIVTLLVCKGSREVIVSAFAYDLHLHIIFCLMRTPGPEGERSFCDLKKKKKNLLFHSSKL